MYLLHNINIYIYTYQILYTYYILYLYYIYICLIYIYIRQYYLRKWFKDPSYNGEGFRDVVDWEYYKERLGWYIYSLCVYTMNEFVYVYNVYVYEVCICTMCICNVYVCICMYMSLYICGYMCKQCV